MVWLIWGVAGVVCIGRDSGAGVASNAATAVVPPSMGGVAYGRLGAGPWCACMGVRYVAVSPTYPSLTSPG